MNDLGAGRRGSDLRTKFTNTTFGWSQDVVDGALIVLSNAGLVRVTGEDGKPASLSDLPRQKLGTCTFRTETAVITVTQRVAVRGLLTDACIIFENGQEAFALSALFDRLQAMAARSGGEPPAPTPEFVPDLAKYKNLTGNDLLAALAANTSTLRDKIKAWNEAARKIDARRGSWSLAERQVHLGADAHSRDLVGDRNPREHEFAVQIRSFDAAKSCTQVGVGVLAALCSALLGKSLKGGLIVAGGINLGGSIEPIHNPIDVVELALEKGASTIMMPVSCRRPLIDLSDEVATKVQILYYADAPDALRKALHD